MSMRFTVDQRGRFAEKIMELGNLVFVGLVIGQVVPGTGAFRLGMAITGIVDLAGAYLVAYYIMKGGAQ